MFSPGSLVDSAAQQNALLQVHAGALGCRVQSNSKLINCISCLCNTAMLLRGYSRNRAPMSAGYCPIKSAQGGPLRGIEPIMATER